MSQFGNGLGGLHSDVLNANPTDQASKDRLIDEIKNRAKGSLTTKSYPEAVALYSKAIELRPDDAILYANRSMCQLNMSKTSEALNDAEKAIEFDPSYVKGYFRKGMALVGLKKYSSARDALRKGLDLAPGDKSFTLQLDKLRGEAYQYDGVTSTPNTTTKLPTKTVSSAPVVKKPTSTTTASDGITSPPASTSSSGVMRGYKTTSDGRKTTFFNNELDEKTKELIGDITPKPITLTPEVEQGIIYFCFYLSSMMNYHISSVYVLCELLIGSRFIIHERQCMEYCRNVRKCHLHTMGYRAH
jgi:tetratricopeptide (TPR) repeat protein